MLVLLCIFVMVLQLNFAFSSAVSNSICFNNNKKNVLVQGDPIAFLDGPWGNFSGNFSGDLNDCEGKCLKNPKCAAISHLVKTTNESAVCILHSTTCNKNASNCKTYEGIDYWQRIGTIGSYKQCPSKTPPAKVNSKQPDISVCFLNNTKNVWVTAADSAIVALTGPSKDSKGDLRDDTLYGCLAICLKLPTCLSITYTPKTPNTAFSICMLFSRNCNEAYSCSPAPIPTDYWQRTNTDGSNKLCPPARRSKC